MFLIPFMLTCCMMRFLSHLLLCMCSVCSHVVVLGLSVVLVPCVGGTLTVMRVLLFLCEVSMLRECEGARVTAVLVWGGDSVLLGVSIWVVHVCVLCGYIYIYIYVYIYICIYSAWWLPAHLRSTKCSIMLHLIDICFFPCIC